MDIDNWISVVGIVLTALFSFFLLIATIKSANAARASAEVAKNSLEFQKEQIRKTEEEQEFMKQIYLFRVKKDVKYLYDTVKEAIDAPNYAALKNAYVTQKPSPFELVRYFSEEQRKVIEEIWGLYHKYYNAYWVDKETGHFSAEYEHPKNRGAMSFQYANDIKNLLREL